MRSQKILFFTIVTLLGMLFVSSAQARVCDDGSIQDSDSFKIRSVKVRARYLSLDLPPKGTLYTKSLESELLSNLKKKIDADRSRESTPSSTLNQIIGKISTSTTAEDSSGSSIPEFRIGSYHSCVEIVEPAVCQNEVGQAKCVDITVSARTIRFSPNNPAENLLNAIPRSNSPTILGNVPKPLLFLNPQVGIDYDKKFGLSQNLEVSTNLLDLNEILEGRAVETKSLRLDVKADAKKSLNNSFYDSNVGVSITKFLPSRFVENISGTAKFSAAKLPNGDAAFFENAVSLDGSVLVKPNLPFVKSVFLRGGYARSNNRFISDNARLSIRTKENNFHFRVLVNGQIKRGVLRVGLWTDGGQTANSIFSYKRLAGLAGYAKDIGKGNQTFGLEMLFGAGRISGRIPNYAYFYGTNELKNFVYEANDSSVIEKMPAGPLIRSFGDGQAVNESTGLLNGSKNYRHFNFNLSIPVPKWSKPLIPNESVELDEDVPSACPIATIRDLIKCQAASGEIILGAIYKKQGVTNFQEKARQEFKGIKSSIDFLTDHANLYSVKPLFMFDAASFNELSGRNRTRFAAGGGLQVNIVIAKFEAGYMRTLNPFFGDSRGNFIMRLYFQNLF